MSTLQKSKNSPINSPVLNTDPTDTSLKELVGEAQALFQVLDSVSTKIRDFEKQLGELKAHFPFRYFLREDKPSALKELSEQQLNRIEHISNADNALRYRTKTCWYFAWEAEENSKNFRLFLTSTQKEIIVWAICGGTVEEIEPYESEVLFRRPLIEMDLPTRLQFAEYLSAFISDFKEYLRRCRMSIEGQKVDLHGDKRLTPLEHFLTYNPISGKHDFRFEQK